MFESPVSAFAVYQNQNKNKKSKLKKIPKVAPPSIQKAKTKKQHLLKTNGIAKVIAEERQKLEVTSVQKFHKKEKKKKKKVKQHVRNSSPISDALSSDSEINEIAASPKIKQKDMNSSSEDSVNFHNKPLQAFEWILAPIKPKDFFENDWEKAPVFIKRKIPHYYNNILSTEKLDQILRENSLFYTRNVDVVSYVNGTRETHNPEGRAVPAALWDYYQNGCSIRILNPHTYCPKLHSLLAALQEYFGCMAGVNTYLTPPGSQGFAPHYDDIEAFVLQLEGRKHWKLYAPLTDAEILPRFSSKNLDRSVLKAPIKEITLEAGDLLYFPRGIIHEGFTDADAHSLHITVSLYQKTAYVDLLEHILKPALAAASEEDIQFRQGLPVQYLQHVGLARAKNSSSTRTEIISKVQQLLTKMVEYIDVDAAADQLGKQFMWDSLPPVPSKQEKQHMVHENGERILNGRIYNKVEITLDIKIRLLRYHCLHVAKEKEEEEINSVRIYYNTENAKFYHGEEQQFIVIDVSLVPAVKYLVQSYPKFIEVKSLPLKDNTDKMQLVSDLWEKGLLVTHQPLEYNDN